MVVIRLPNVTLHTRSSETQTEKTIHEERKKFNNYQTNN